MPKMTLKEAQEVLENWKHDLLEAESVYPMSVTQWSIEDWSNHINKLLEAARVVERGKIKQFLKETICSCKCEHLNAKELLDNQEGK